MEGRNGISLYGTAAIWKDLSIYKSKCSFGIHHASESSIHGIFGPVEEGGGQLDEERITR